MAYEEGLQVDEKSDVLKKGLAEVQRAMDHDAMGPGGDMGLGAMFKDPQLMAKLAANPKTKDFVNDPSFVEKIKQLQSNGGKADMASLFGDPRMMSVLGVLMGVDIVSERVGWLTLGCYGAPRGLQRDATGSSAYGK